MAIIEVDQLMKEFKVAKRETGFLGAMKSLVKREFYTKHAVKDVSFTVDKGEMVGYIGPNGAGKSTTIKMLTGILVPSAGTVKVNGIVPYENRQARTNDWVRRSGERTHADIYKRNQ
ncbi:ATP-binding cassette domain-containing protein [Cytobacillus sp. OWB-43]|uniref:ATP-binding cassette domain-containing protein n=1 Tax=Cytobacillus sp. OWB-43 TaxID=3108468 RepID=UPI002AFF4245|nr:ATP-binding cassette domain-containing protein [Cytobacillus sp. OWB-43]MEA1853838.1 ATP-binding cassette domain-containing protein [Cytobacillus sp. OWB-43]